MSFLITCSSIALRDDSASHAMASIADAGFRGVEFWSQHLQGLSNSDLSALAAQARERDLSIPIISPYLTFTRGADKILESLRTAEEVMETASYFGATKIRTFVDIGPDGVPSDCADERLWKEAVQGLRELCDLDPEKEFVVETHKNTLADTLPSVKRLIGEVARPNFKINYQANPDFLRRGFLACLEDLWPMVSHMHWQQYRDDGSETYIEEDGVLDFHGLLSVLRSKNYQGTATVEYCWTPVERSRIASAAQFLLNLTQVSYEKP